MAASYQTIELKTVFDWGSDGGFAPAVEMCNGAGVCRKLGAGTMCPSYMATRDERDTTRGRANCPAQCARRTHPSRRTLLAKRCMG